ncbi:hypothetical protein BGZ72_004551 [Mortierella alpina]|nr:hypothetical protein BGZ72_004551 [Mortierella alpina]
MTLFSEDSSFLAFADGKLFEILLKAFLYYHLVFHGRLYQGGLLSYPGAQSFYSSGASDDGEAFSHQSNFRSSRQSPVVSRSGGLSRATRKGNPAYPGSTSFGSTAHYRSPHTRSGSASSHESSDMERSIPDWRDPKLNARRQHADELQHQHQHHEKGYGNDKYHDRVELSEDDSAQNGGQMQYTTSQGMRKWKKWFEYWSAKSVAMIDPALAAFGRPESAAPLDGDPGGPNWRKRSNSRRSSPTRRSKNSPSHHHQSPSRTREAREREKERDRERDRERNRKTTFDHYSVAKERGPMFSSSDSEFPRGDDALLITTGASKKEMDALEPRESRAGNSEDCSDYSRAGDTQDKAEAQTPKTNSGKSSGLRRLKPKRPLTLHGSFSKSTHREDGKKEGRDAAIAVTGETLARTPSSGSAASPPPSATFRSLAGAFRAMSFGSSTASANAKGSTVSNPSIGHLGSPTKYQERHSIEEHLSGRSSHDFSDSVLHHREVKRRGSARAKAKAWFKAKRKRRSRGYDDDGAIHEGGDVDEQRSGPSDEEHDVSDAEESRDGQEISCPNDEGQLPEQGIHEIGQETKGHGPPPKSAPARTESASATLKTIPPIQSHSAIDLTEALSKPVVLPDEPLPLDTQLTIQEIAALEPTTRTQSRVLMMPTVSAATMNAVSSSNNSSRISSANGSRITSPLAPSFSADPRHRMESISALISRRKESKPLLRTEADALLSTDDLRSEVYDSEQDRRWDFGKESATEYETSAETFANDRASVVSGPGSGNQRSAESSGRPSLDATSASAGQTKGSLSNSGATLKSSLLQQDPALSGKVKIGAGKSDKDTVTLTEEEELAVREMIGGVTGADDWIIIVHLATMVDEYERSKGSDIAAME